MDEPASVEELQASRARVATAADDERRRIERALHDGVQQHLVALAVNLQLAREFADSDPSALKTLLDEIGQDVHAALESVRALAYGVYPPLLLDRGLVDALRGAAAGLAIATQVEAEPTERYPAGVEATAYFCCVDALEDVGAHAGPGALATVRVKTAEGALLLEVVIDADAGPSETTLTTMGDRVGAAGGQLSVDVDQGRTRILVRIPLAP